MGCGCYGGSVLMADVVLFVVLFALPISFSLAAIFGVDAD